jgi:hypothetical protein
MYFIFGSSDGPLVPIPDCKPAVLGLNPPAISPAYSGLPVLRWAAIWDGCPLRGGRGEHKQVGFSPAKKTILLALKFYFYGLKCPSKSVGLVLRIFTVVGIVSSKFGTAM